MTAMPPIMTEMPADSPLEAALEQLRLQGAIFFRSEFTEPWAYESPPPEAIAGMLHPGAPRLIMFHIVTSGRCWVNANGGEKHWAEAGAVVVLPYGDQHQVGGTGETTVVQISDLFAPPPWERLPVLRHGGGGEPTDIVCGYLHSTDPLFDPRLRALPPVFVVQLAGSPAAQWVQASMDYAVAQSDASISPGRTPTRLPELLVTEVLRTHLASAPAIEHGWIAALRDPVLGRALAAIHGQPGRQWSLAALADEAAVSRSALDERFREKLGISPIRYLTDWRMHIAGELLRSTDFGIVKIARQIGYDSEEAFSRAFKRHYGASPGRWRAAPC